MSLPRVILLGTVHLDPDGVERIAGRLREIAPDLITVDVSRYAVCFRRKRRDELIGRLAPFRGPDGSLPPALVPVAGQLDIPCEVIAAERFARESGARVRLIGNNADSHRRLALFVDELLAEENLCRLASHPAPPLPIQVRDAWARARRWLHASALAPSVAGLETEDRRMARWIAGWWQQAQPTSIQDGKALRQTLVHVVGWEHLAGLARHLRDQRPVVMLADAPVMVQVG